MKLSSSPLKNKSLNEPAHSIKSRIQKQLQRPYKPIITLFSKNQQEQKTKNTNSIKKVLKELTDLKKQLKEFKNASKQQKISQPLDMSQCRKLQYQKKKSPESRKNYSKSNSSSKNKSNSQPKRQTSTQTLQKYREVNDFSFSIDSKVDKKNKGHSKEQSEEDDSSINEQELSNKKSAVSTKRLLHKSFISPKKININEEISSKVATIQQNQLYEHNLNSLKLGLQTFQISTPLLFTEDKLRLNLQIQRLSKHISRIPVYFKQPEQYYEAMQLYARSLNNQLNNFILILNRSQCQTDRFRERRLNSPNKDQQFECKKCDDNEKKGAEKANRKQLKRYQKELQRLLSEMAYKDSLIKQLKQSQQNLINELTEYKQISKMHKQNSSQATQKCDKLKNELIKFQKQKQNLQIKQKQREDKIKLLEQDLSYYRSQIQRIKSNNRGRLKSQREENENSYPQPRNRQLQSIVTELRDKQKLYEIILQQKDYIIKSLQTKKHIEYHDKTQPKNKRMQVKQHEQQSIDSADYYKLKMDIQDLQNKIITQKQQITNLKEQKTKLQLKNQENASSLQLCLAQINQLHSEISILQQANQKYKDKCLKSRIVNERKNKKQSETQAKKGQTFQQIKQLIKHHKQEISKQR